jgi:hypothetical protein
VLEQAQESTTFREMALELRPGSGRVNDQQESVRVQNGSGKLAAQS